MRCVGLLSWSLGAAWIYTKGMSPDTHPPIYPGIPCETHGNNWTALWFRGFSWCKSSTRSMQRLHLLPLSPGFPANFHIPRLEPSPWSISSPSWLGPMMGFPPPLQRHKRYQRSVVPRNRIAVGVDQTWTDPDEWVPFPPSCWSGSAAWAETGNLWTWSSWRQHRKAPWKEENGIGSSKMTTSLWWSDKVEDIPTLWNLYFLPPVQIRWMKLNIQSRQASGAILNKMTCENHNNAGMQLMIVIQAKGAVGFELNIPCLLEDYHEAV